MASILGEIKRRKVFQVAAVYAVVAWLLVQVVATIEQPLNLPGWFATVIIVSLAVGFPIALILAWAFDVTPAGIRAASDATATHQTTPRGGQRLNYLMHGLVLAAIGFLVFDQYFLTPRSELSPALNSGRESSPTVLRTLEVALGETERIGDTALNAHIAISRDGRDIVFAAQREGRSQLFHRPIDELESTPIPGTDGAFFPAFSPDGDWVLFFEAQAENVLKKVSIETGAVQTLGPAPFPNGGSWREDGTLFVATQDGTGGRSVFSLSANGSEEWTEILSADNNQGFVEPDILPSGDVLVVGVRPGIGGVGSARMGRIISLNLRTGETADLIQEGFRPRYAPSGHLVFARRGDLWAVPFDAEKLQITGDEVLVIPGVQQDGGFGKAAFAFSDEGTLVYLPGVDTTARNTPRSLVWVDRDGNEEAIARAKNAYYWPRLSGDGRLAVSIFDGRDADIHIYDFRNGSLNRLTFDGADRALWSKDANRVYFNRTGTDGGLFWKAPDGSGEPQRLTTTNSLQRPVSLSADGSELIFGQVTENNWDLYSLSLREGTERILLDEQNDVLWGQVSPDGRHILYTAQRRGINEIFVRSYPGLTGRRQISQGGGYEAMWSPDGDEIFFRRNREFYVASIESDSGGIVVIESHRLFGTDSYYDDNNNRPTYDVAADGQRFLMIKPEVEGVVAQSGQSSLVVVENFFERLSRLAPPAENFE